MQIPQAVLAHGRLLPPATYELQLTSDEVVLAPGQAPGAERWIAFVLRGTVVGRELASVVSDAEIDQVAEGPPPAAGTTRVDLLKGGEFVRVWINRDSVHYIINLSVPTEPSDLMGVVPAHWGLAPGAWWLKPGAWSLEPGASQASGSDL